ncbi:MAG: tetratricopeptide repeat protein [Candidatus Thiodiazotropha sp. (ex Epidulcina cf. delphinae)]|nr:tetratricopeptide repeat protein [Candidatus Thiodiazotropha sp. (ex Epidulcina cf. delphinae)]
MLSLALNHYFSGLEPTAFKITNLLIHLINAVSIFFFVFLSLRLLTVTQDLPHSPTTLVGTSLAVAAGWALHPVNLTSVLYIVQRMASLSALFCLWGMIAYLLARKRMIEGKPHGGLLILLALGLGTLFSIAAKENGILLPLLLLVIEWTLFGFRTVNASDRRRLTILLYGATGLPLIAAAIFFITNPGWLASLYELRDFSMIERLLTESRVLWIYLGLLLIPRPARFSLFHDDIPISHGLTDPWTTLAACAGLIVLFATALFCRKREPVLSFGILFFFCGHLLESTIFPLEIAHEHRNYLPSVGVFMAVFYYLMKAPVKIGNIHLGRTAIPLVILFLSLITWNRASIWATPLDLALVNLESHPNSPRWQFETGRVYEELSLHQNKRGKELANLAINHFQQAARLGGDHQAAGLIAIVHMSTIHKRDISTSLLDELNDALSNAKVGATSILNLEQLTLCVAHQECYLPYETIENFHESVMANPVISRSARGRLKADLAQLALNIGRPSDALDLLQQAVEDNPAHVQHYLNLAYVQILLGQTQAAEITLADASAHDRFGNNETRITAIVKQLDKAKAKRDTNANKAQPDNNLKVN